MRAGQRSRTAEATAGLRAIHQRFDALPRVLDDPFAARFLSPVLRFALTPLPGTQRRLERLLFSRLRLFGLQRPTTGVRRIRAQVLVRSRYAEDRLQELVEQGIDQFVLLAAGLDSFALRRSDLAARLRVYELDHPDTQHFKSQQLRTLGVEMPANLELVPCDFEKQSLEEALSTSSYDPARSAFFSWLGVSYYLTEAAIRDTFRFLGEQASGSEAVFDYWTTGRTSRPADRALLDSIRASVAGQGERMVSFFEPAEMKDLLEQCGLRVIEDLDGDAADERYLDGRPDGLRMPDFAHLMTVHCD